MTDRDLDRFSRWASNYDEDWLQPRFFGPVHQATLKRALELVPAPGRVLDIGCGSGLLLRQTAERWAGPELFGIDPARGMVEAAARSWQAAQPAAFINATAEKLPFADGSFDLILSTVSFHHWHEQQAGLYEVTRTLAPGGTFVLSDIFAVSVLRPLFFLFRNRARFHTQNEIEAMIRRAGLTPMCFATAFSVAGVAAVSMIWGTR